MNTTAFYDMIKKSPLAKDRNATALEEVAIWLDMNNMSTRNSIMKILKAIEKNYHNTAYDYIENYIQHQFVPSNGKTIRIPSVWLTSPFFSDNALYWIFKLCIETNVLDNIVLDKKFIDFVKKTKDKHRKKTMTYRTIGSMKLPTLSQTDQGLYEVFAELMDIIEKKKQNAN